MNSAKALEQAAKIAVRDLLKERDDAGHWLGELASSALSTATAVSALSIVRRELAKQTNELPSGLQPIPNQLIDGGIRWLIARQNPDGGWGDTDRNLSNIATTMLVDAAFRLAGVAEQYHEVLNHARSYINAQGGIPGLHRRYGKDKTFAVPILTNCALAGQVNWSEVSQLPFEMACFPQKMLGALQLPVVSYALPALIGIGLVRYHHRKPWNPVIRWARSAATDTALKVLTKIQPESGGFLEATPLTSFVTMSLAGCGRVLHPVVKQGVQFLIDSVREDGSWPIDTNLATWGTTLSINALDACNQPVHELGCLDWVLDCQHREVHPYTGAAPGGWAWTDLSGGVPDADDTSGAMLALAAWERSAEKHQVPEDPRLREAASWGAKWLIDLQNRDQGWPTFCKGWGALPFDRSSTDITAHAIRGLHAWQGKLAPRNVITPSIKLQYEKFDLKISQAIERGFQYLRKQQNEDGSWFPLWFGNQFFHDEENPVYGTAKVLMAYRDLQRLNEPQAQRGLEWLVSHQNTDGGWGGGHSLEATFAGEEDEIRSSVEETAITVEILLAKQTDQKYRKSVERGLNWLVKVVLDGQYKQCSPIGFYFAKLWYYEKLYPLVFTASALGQAILSLKSTSDITSSIIQPEQTHSMHH